MMEQALDYCSYHDNDKIIRYDNKTMGDESHQSDPRCVMEGVSLSPPAGGARALEPLAATQQR